MGSKSCARWAAIAMLAALLSGCGSDRKEAADDSVPYDDDSGLPVRYGLYVVEHGRLARVDGEKDFQVQTWESRSNLQQDVTFVVFDRALADRSVRLDEAIMLRKVARVRNDIGVSGATKPLAQDTWVAPDGPAFAVPLDFQPVPGAPEMVRVIPTRPLTPGLYSLQLRLGQSAVAGRFGVQWSTIDKSQYAAAHCVDRYGGAAAAYKPCGESLTALPPQSLSRQPLQQRPLAPQQPPPENTFQKQLVQPYRTPPAVPQAPEPPRQAAQPVPDKQLWQVPEEQAPQQPAPMPSSQGLKLRDVQAARNVDQGVAILTVEGTIVNTAKAPRRVPQLMATVSDTKGTELTRWTFDAELVELPPGGSTGFRSETLYPTNQSTNVAVTFASDSTAQAQ